jgi:hypothetical protein
MAQTPRFRTPLGRTKHIFTSTCCFLAVWIAFQIVREDPEISPLLTHDDADATTTTVSDLHAGSSNGSVRGKKADNSISEGQLRDDIEYAPTTLHDDAPERVENVKHATISISNGIDEVKNTSDENSEELKSSNQASTIDTTTEAELDESSVNNTTKLSATTSPASNTATVTVNQNAADESKSGTKSSNQTSTTIDNYATTSTELDVPKNATTSSRSTNTTSTTNQIPNRRIQQFDPTKQFSFIHISKAAGATWIRTLLDLALDVCPAEEAGKEYPVHHQTTSKCKNAQYHMLSLRSPRHHVWSLFTECKYDGWGYRTTKGLGFPRTGNNSTRDEVDFHSWLDHFLPMNDDHIDNYKCYHPANFQTRYLDSKVSAAHGVANRPNGTLRFEGNLTLATATYWKLDFVPIVELHHESLCLFYHRLGPNAPEKAVMYLNSQCVCPKPTTNDKNLQMVHIVHHENGHRKELRTLPSEILKKIEVLTRVDMELYLVGLRQILKEIAWLESNDGVRRRVLCDGVLEKLEPELEYLNVSVLQLYDEAKTLVSG